MKLTQFVGGALAWLGLVLLLGAAESVAADAREPSCRKGSSGVPLPIALGESVEFIETARGASGGRVVSLDVARTSRLRVLATGSDGVLAVTPAGEGDAVAAGPVGVGLDVELAAGRWCLRTVAGAGGIRAIHVLPAETAPDRNVNRLRNATKVRVRTGTKRVTGRIDGTNDLDYFRIEPQAEGRLEIRSDGETHLGGVLFALPGGSAPSPAIGARIWRGVADAERDKAFIVSAPVEPGLAYFVVVYGQGATPGRYGLAVSLGPARSMASPVPVAVGSSVQGRILSPDDEEFFRIEPDAPTNLRVFSLGAADVQAVLLDANGNEVARDDDGGDGFNFLLRATVSEPHVVRVSAAGVPLGAYEILVMREQASLDDSTGLGDAMALRLGESVEARFSNEHDTDDYYVLEVPERLEARIASYGPLDTVAALLDGNGGLLAINDDGGEGGNFLLKPTLGPGTYYLRVERFDGERPGVYGVRLEEGGVRVGDDDANLAHAESPRLSVGEFRIGAIDPARDADYYRLRIAEAGEVRVWTEGAEVDTVGDLFAAGSDGFLLHDDDSGEDTNFSLVGHLDEGDYFVRVAGLGDRTGSYALHAARLEDDHTGSRGGATPAAPGTVLDGVISVIGDVDYFWIPPSPVAGTSSIVAYTTGTLDTVGAFETEAGDPLAEDDDSGVDGNFRMELATNGAGAFLRVAGYDCEVGPYRLVVESLAD